MPKILMSAKVLSPIHLLPCPGISPKFSSFLKFYGLPQRLPITKNPVQISIPALYLPLSKILPPSRIFYKFLSYFVLLYLILANNYLHHPFVLLVEVVLPYTQKISKIRPIFSKLTYLLLYPMV